jgi:hypothetical protein
VRRTPTKPRAGAPGDGTSGTCGVENPSIVEAGKLLVMMIRRVAN